MNTPRTTGADSARVCAAALAALTAWTLFAGKDVSWDVVNHHLYLPFSLMTDVGG